MMMLREHDISIHALREEGDRRKHIMRYPSLISIHALREEGDRRKHIMRYPSLISIHALREEGDYQVVFCYPQACYFYPRPPRGGRRGEVRHLCIIQNDFYPRPPRGGRPCYPAERSARPYISIHALREEGDIVLNIVPLAVAIFLSTPSARRATGMGTVGLTTPLPFLSTPSARRATCCCRSQGHELRHFYPRPPRGGRP